MTADDLDRVVAAVGGSIQTTCSDIRPEHLGTCETFNELQIGGERYNLFEGTPAAKTCTLILRGGAEQFIAEVERSLHDAIMIVKRAIKNNYIVAGGGACEVPLFVSVGIDVLDGNLEISASIRPYNQRQTTTHHRRIRQSPRNNPSTTLRQRRFRQHRHPKQTSYATCPRRNLGRRRHSI